MNKDKVGDIRATGYCSSCGAVLQEEYTSEPIYHNKTTEFWRRVAHNTDYCITILRTRIEALERTLGDICYKHQLF